MQIKKNVIVKSHDSLFADSQRGLINFVGQYYIEFRDDNPDIKISGTLNYPGVKGKIYFDEGYINFLDRKFLILSKKEQEAFSSGGQRTAEDNYIELKETDRDLKPYFNLAAQTIIYETLAPSSNAGGVTSSITQIPEIKEKSYLLNIRGPMTELSSLSFERYILKSNVYKLDGEAYILEDKTTGKKLDPYRFQELAYDIAPPLLKSAFSALEGSTDSLAKASRDTARDLTITEINLFARMLMRPVERRIASQTGLYDLRIKRDLGLDAANLLKLNDQQLLQSEPVIVEHMVGLERLYFTLDTSIDKNLQSQNYNMIVYSYKLTWKILKETLIDELSLNVGNELDEYNNAYLPVLSIEAIHSF